MAPVILVLNSGSSSIKFNLYCGTRTELSGQVSGLGASPHLSLKSHVAALTIDRDLGADAGRSHRDALNALLPLLEAAMNDRPVDAVGHRVVHGGTNYTKPVRIDAQILDQLKMLEPLAPLHQPHNIAGILAAQDAFPEAVQTACFDTAFHRKHPFVNDTFALPRSYYDEGVRRYGFHGLSYEYICDYLHKSDTDVDRGKVIVAHLGNGASMCAIRNGQSVGSTMGFTALDGLPMGTRCGQLDPGVVLYLLTTKGMSPDEVSDLLYTNSGLKGLSGISQDMRTLSQSSEPRAKEAIDYFVFRIRRELGAMAAVLSGLDTLVFTGGIGENAANIRSRVCVDQDWLGMSIDEEKNRENQIDISAEGSRIKVLVIPTNEEEMIRRHTEALM